MGTEGLLQRRFFGFDLTLDSGRSNGISML